MDDDLRGIPFEVAETPPIRTNFSNILELRGRKDILIRVLGRKSYEEEKMAAYPKYEVDRQADGSLIVKENSKESPFGFQDWAKRVKTQVDFLTGPDSVFRNHVPITSVCIGGEAADPRVCLATEKVDGVDFGPTSQDFLKHIGEFGQIVGLGLDSIRDQLQKGEKEIKVPDIFSFDNEEGGHCFRFRNFKYGSIKGGENRLYLVDVYPLRAADVRDVKMVLETFKHSVSVLDRDMFDGWLSEEGTLVSKPIMKEDDNFLRWLAKKSRCSIEDAREFMFDEDIKEYLYISRWGNGEDLSQKKYNAWFEQKRDLMKKIEGMGVS